MADDALAPDAIARRDFDVARRGFDQQAVRGYLHWLSSEVAALNRQLVELRGRAERAETRAALAAEPDEAYLLERLGEETTRVLGSAREAAAEIRAKAEESAGRLISEAQAEAAGARSSADEDATRTRAEAEAAAATLLENATSEAEALLTEARGELDRAQAEAREAAAAIVEAAEVEAERIRTAAEADAAEERSGAEAELEAAREQGREMVAEAQAVRERVLRDMAARRRKARQQVEKLNAGRERLLTAYATVRSTLDDATLELTASLGEARLAADAAARRVADEPEETVDELEAEVAAARLVDPSLGHAPAGGDLAPEAEDDDDRPGPLSGEVPAVDANEPGAGSGEGAVERAGGVQAVEEGGQGAAAGPGPSSPPEATGSPATASQARAPSGRGRTKRRRRNAPAEVIAGLPEAELVPLDPSADFEQVRVLAEPTGPPVEAEPAVGGHQPAGEPGTADPEAPEPEVLEGPQEPAAADEEPQDPGSAPARSEPASELPPGPEAGEPPPDPAVEATDVPARPDAEPPPVAEAEAEADELPQPDEAGEADEAAPAPGVGAPEPTAQAEAPGTEGARPSAATESGGEVEEESEPDAAAGPATEAKVDDLFARLRAEAATEPSPEGGDAPGDEGALVDDADAPVEAAAPGNGHGPGVDSTGEADADQQAVAARDEVLGPAERELARRLKRVLADEQNEVLDLLRRTKPTGLADVLPPAVEHAARWAEAGRDALAAAAGAGARSVDPDAAEAGDPSTVPGDLAVALVAPLRERIERCFETSDGDLDELTDRIRALYREWKGQRLAEAVRDHALAAHAVGTLAALPASCQVRWVVDAGGDPCPDAEDNALAGALTKGAAFPTGHAAPPAHPGCRCLVVRAEPRAAQQG